MVGRVGIEPTTSRLKAECSTSELTPLLDQRRDDTEPRRNDNRRAPIILYPFRLHSLEILICEPRSGRGRVVGLHAR